MELIYIIYCSIHKIAKTFLGKYITSNDYKTYKNTKISLGVNAHESIKSWMKFINNSIINNNEELANLHYAGYLKEAKSWCLPSWIWTNAALVRMYLKMNKINDAIIIADKIISLQQSCGGWIVRNDYDKEGEKPILAPNDSAYIAKNAMLSCYNITNNNKYLISAIRCADWIITTSRSDGIVYTGYDTRSNKWDKSHIIVDIGFTAGLFSDLYEITKDTKYKDFLKKFIYKYINLFYVSTKHCFCTNIDKNDKQNKGLFGRGQAWALEGLIPSFKTLNDSYIKKIINETIETLIKEQNKNGSWSYNLANKLMGEDCKGTSVLAKNIMDWYLITHDDGIKKCAKRALKWCMLHTSNSGITEGGIYSYCLEGGIVQNLYSTCAFVYASSYAIELYHQLHYE